MIQVLSTKILTQKQKLLLDPDLFNLLEYDAISVTAASFTFRELPDNLIFTSQNAVRFFFNSVNPSQLNETTNCYCVGEKTKSLLLKNGLKFVKMAQNGEELGHYLVEKVKNGSFLHICGNRTRPELPALLRKGGLHYSSLIVYNTKVHPRVFADPINAILFFSPTGVESFTTKNKITVETVFCIGDTTAAAVSPLTDDIVLPEHQSVEGVLKRLSDYYQSSIAN